MHAVYPIRKIIWLKFILNIDSRPVFPEVTNFPTIFSNIGDIALVCCASVYDTNILTLPPKFEDLLEREAREGQAETLAEGNWEMVPESFSCYDEETYRLEAGLPVTRLTRTGWVEVPEALQYAFRTRP